MSLIRRLATPPTRILPGSNYQGTMAAYTLIEKKRATATANQPRNCICSSSLVHIVPSYAKVEMLLRLRPYRVVRREMSSYNGLAKT